MKYYVYDMNRKYAELISNWTYEQPYNIYSGDGSNEYMDELLVGSYYTVLNEKDDIIGFYCFGKAAQVPAGNEYGAYEKTNFLDVGLGIRPDLCGKGIGYDFMVKQLEYAQSKLTSENFRLTVADFNKRAIKLYEKLGFVKTMTFKRKGQNGEMEFLIMEKRNDR
ncbi:GNAT family N-acetyltransferase [Vallitalea guaymasensis]|uniref:GNAT family N-acetyltransferase n=1 Tax=Vallitalea guaymasensis TaxID=1185412 RepID=UPI0023538F77|nr:GNAT family protein [Vallitalea guaymasensis]